MAYIEDGLRFAAIKGQLFKKADLVTVVGEVIGEPRVNGRKGHAIADARLVVAPAEGTLTGAQLHQLGIDVLSDTQPIFPNGIVSRVDSNGENTDFVTFRSFDTLNTGGFRAIHVEVYPNTDAAQHALDFKK